MTARLDHLVPLVRPAAHEDLDRCLEIIVGLPEYFTADVASSVAADYAQHSPWVVVDGSATVGFAVVARRSPLAAEILWAAVAASHRGTGFGTALIDHLAERLTDYGVRVVEVKTLDRSAGYPPYRSTIGFWERRGFILIDVIDPLPGWQPGNPCAIYVQALPRQ